MSKDYSPEAQAQFCEDIAKHFGVAVVSKRQINEYVKLNKLPYPEFIFSKKFQASFGHYRVAEDKAVSEGFELNTATATVSPIQPAVESVRVFSRKLAANITEQLVPETDKTYVPFGFYNDLKKIISSRIFYPVYITGLSGNGKTVMVEQICAKLGRELVRINITKETDETDLIGGYELIDGNTVRREGPVVTAMRKGAILLLDETDYGSERLLCLQPILEGKPYFDKKTGEVITPADGFNIMATANTKGKGSDDGRFIGANVLNEAFLERFAITVEQEYPDASVEKQILIRNFNFLGIDDSTFIDNLVTWAEIVRKTYLEGGVDEIISTRRLVHISKAFSIFNNRLKAVELCLNRFDDDTKRSFIDLYNKVDDVATVAAKTYTVSPESAKVATLNNLEDEEDDFFKQAPPPKVAKPSTFTTIPTGKTNTHPAPPATGGSVTAIPPQVANTSTNSKKLPSWANAVVLLQMTQKYNEKIGIMHDGLNDDWIVSTHGHQTAVQANALAKQKEKSAGHFLELLVSCNKEKAAGNIKPEYRPIH